MDMLELLNLLSSNLSTLTVNVNSDKDWVDIASLISPMLIGFAALWISYLSMQASASTAKSTALLQAEMEVATKLKYEWIDSIRDLSSKYSASVDLILSLSFRMNSIISTIKHYKVIGSNNPDIKDLDDNRINVYNELFVEKKNLMSLSKKIMLYFDSNSHPKITRLAKEIVSMVSVENPANDTYKITTKLEELECEFYNIINTEWGSMISFPSKNKL